MKYKCIKDMYYEGFNPHLGFKKGNVYEADADADESYLIDEFGDKNFYDEEEWLNEYFVEYTEEVCLAEHNRLIILAKAIEWAAKKGTFATSQKGIEMIIDQYIEALKNEKA